MDVEIFDVGHGGCAVATSPIGSKLMLDCGFNSDKRWFPSLEYSGQCIDTLMLTNLDEDHVADLRYLLESASVQSLVTNPTISAKALEDMKTQGMNEGVREAFDQIARHGNGLIGAWRRYLGGIHWHAFYNRYKLDFEDTNNLSLAVFVSFGRFTMLFGGDMERPAWNKLLLQPAFRARLPEVSVYVASHHGRENGLSENLLSLMRPEVVVVSDGPKQYATQETTSWYANRAIGIPDLDQVSLGYPNAKRRVVTTRRDGSLKIRAYANGRYLIITEGRRMNFPSTRSKRTVFKASYLSH